MYGHIVYFSASIQESIQPIHYAALTGQLKTIRLFIEVYKIDPNVDTEV